MAERRRTFFALIVGYFVEKGGVCAKCFRGMVKWCGRRAIFLENIMIKMKSSLYC